MNKTEENKESIMETKKSKSNWNVTVMLFIILVLVVMAGTLGLGSAVIFLFGVILGALWYSVWSLERSEIAITVETHFNAPVGFDDHALSEQIRADIRAEVMEHLEEMNRKRGSRRG